MAGIQTLPRRSETIRTLLLRRMEMLTALRRTPAIRMLFRRLGTIRTAAIRRR
jgi:hypothetical protein